MRFAGASGKGQDYINAAMKASKDINKVIGASTPSWSQMSGQAGKSRAEEMISGLNAQAVTTSAGLQGLASAKQGAFQAAAIKAQGDAEAAAAQAQGMGDMISGIGGGLIGAFGKKGGASGFGGYTPYKGAFTPGGSLDTFGDGGFKSITGNSINSFGGNSFGAFQPGAKFNVPSVF